MSERGSEPMVLEVEGLGVDLGGRRILDRVSFTLEQGDFCGLIGSNGAGKTTLLRVILGLIRPSEGRVRTAAPRTGNTPAIGYVPQKIALEPDVPMRARDLVGLGIDGQRLGVPGPGAARRAVVDDMLHAVGADAFADSRVGTLSGGEQQRVMIAHALIARPQLLLLDEPLANLDIRAANEVVDLLARIAAEQRIGILLSAHDMNPLLGAMNRAVYLAHGRAVAGTTDEVIRTDTLSRLYGYPVEVIRAQGRVLVVAGEADSAHCEDRSATAAGSQGATAGRA